MVPGFLIYNMMKRAFLNYRLEKYPTVGGRIGMKWAGNGRRPAKIEKKIVAWSDMPNGAFFVWRGAVHLQHEVTQPELACVEVDWPMANVVWAVQLHIW